MGWRGMGWDDVGWDGMGWDRCGASGTRAARGGNESPTCLSLCEQDDAACGYEVSSKDLNISDRAWDRGGSGGCCFSKRRA